MVGMGVRNSVCGDTHLKTIRDGVSFALSNSRGYNYNEYLEDSRD